jgi:hypothetical protein
MYESVSRVLENQAESIMAALELKNAARFNDFLQKVEALAPRPYYIEADFIKKVTTPFVREWASIICEVRLVSVDIDHDEAHLLHAEYDRDTVIELLTARLALEEKEPETSIGSEGRLEESNSLFECSGQHFDHSANFHAETVIGSTGDSASTVRNLSRYLENLRQAGTFTKEEWRQFEFDARRGERFVRENFADMAHLAFMFLMELSVLYVKENPVSAEEFRARQEKALARLREWLPRPEEGRPEGTGLFRTPRDFELALKDVLGKARKKPSQREVLHAIRQHPLCRKQTTDFPSQNETKTLRNWLTKCGLTYKEALEKYWKLAQSVLAGVRV